MRPPSSTLAVTHDPVVAARIRLSYPTLWSGHHRFVQSAHRAEVDRIREIDEEIDALAADRRRSVRRLERYRERLFPERRPGRRRRRPGVDDAPFPPAPVDALPLVGTDLRQAALSVLRRHGALPLREIHAMFHRYGYAIDGNRPVQRLGDALAYELARGRVERVARGVYAPVGGTDEFVLDEPALAWDDPDQFGAPVLDPDVRIDPERWSSGSWSASAACGGEVTGGPITSVADHVEDVLDQVTRARERLAELLCRTRPVEWPEWVRRSIAHLGGPPLDSSPDEGPGAFDPPHRPADGEAPRPGRQPGPEHLRVDSSTNRRASRLEGDDGSATERAELGDDVGEGVRDGGDVGGGGRPSG